MKAMKAMKAMKTMKTMKTMKKIVTAGALAATVTQAGAQTNVRDYATDPAIESNTKTFLKALNTSGGKPMETLTPAEARKVLEDAQHSVKVNEGGIDVQERMITEDGVSVKIYIIRPAGKTGILPVFMFFHGGGWVLGDFPTHKRLVRDLVVYSGVASVFVEYDRSPEAKYPTALNQCYAATKWVSRHGKEIGVDGSRLAVAGNSVGGNLTAATALMARDKKGPAIRFQLMFWPVTNADFSTASYQAFAEDRFLTRNMMIWFWDSYAPDVERRNEYYASPLKAPLDELKGLPPAMVQTAGNDVLRDEGEAYARKLDEAGVNVTHFRIEGMIHDYGLLNPLASVPAVQAALRAGAIELAHALK